MGCCDGCCDHNDVAPYYAYCTHFEGWLTYLYAICRLHGDGRVVKGKMFGTNNKVHRERGLRMIPLGHEHVVDCFYDTFHKTFYLEANKIGFDMEGANPLTKRAPVKIRGEKAPPTAWEVASNHMLGLASMISAIPQPPRQSRGDPPHIFRLSPCWLARCLVMWLPSSDAPPQRPPSTP
jgi:hypothetical protein